MEQTMKAAVLYAREDLRYEDVPMPQIQKPDEIKIRVISAGICGSDVPRVLGDTSWVYPIVLGHECFGEIVETGSAVTDLKVGDKIIVAPDIPCFECDDCQNGYYGSCRNYDFIGTKRQGGFAEYLVIDRKNAVWLDPGTTYHEAMMFEPATVGCHAMRRAAFRGGSVTAIIGCGTVGIFAVQWARAFGARKVVAFDVVPERLELAKRMGADAVVNSADPDWLDQAMALTDNQGFEYVFEVAGQPATMKMSYYLVRTRGIICMIGYPGVP
ncbi:MAG: alcohol dehydrogenase catalytic domain-containing protein, partial [Lachnospiraceae bacterium]|nr:alcohol dehydrogenase catalytic domain-containing protein [Lachnospiraceae bacterium]